MSTTRFPIKAAGKINAQAVEAVRAPYLGRPVNTTLVTRARLANSTGSALYCDKILTIKEFQQELWTMVDLCKNVVDGGLTWSLVRFEALATLV
jgi:hypothetical protein